MNAHNKDGVNGVGNPYATIKTTYLPDTEEVLVETTLHTADMLSYKTNPTTELFKVQQFKDRKIIESLPDDILMSIAQLYNEELSRRGISESRDDLINECSGCKYEYAKRHLSPCCECLRSIDAVDYYENLNTKI